jgi:AcrR family transcriptional regulator
VAIERTEKISVVACAVKHVTSTGESPNDVVGAFPVNIELNVRVYVTAPSRRRLLGMAKARATRLAVDDWIQAGYEVLAEEGIKSLKVDRLCSRLGVTKGSFYWHFADIASYRIALVDAWGASRDEERRHFGTSTDVPPRDRLSQMMTTLVDARHWTLERAMREWARTDEAVAGSVRAADRRVLAAVRQAFLDYGFDAEEADLRATATFAVGIGFLHLSGPQPSARGAARRERFLDIMLTH